MPQDTNSKKIKIMSAKIRIYRKFLKSLKKINREEFNFKDFYMVARNSMRRKPMPAAWKICLPLISVLYLVVISVLISKGVYGILDNPSLIGKIGIVLSAMITYHDNYQFLKQDIKNNPKLYGAYGDYLLLLTNVFGVLRILGGILAVLGIGYIQTEHKKSVIRHLSEMAREREAFSLAEAENVELEKKNIDLENKYTFLTRQIEESEAEFLKEKQNASRLAGKNSTETE